MASITLSQSKGQVAHLGQAVFDSKRGHNRLTADISGSSLSRAWLEVNPNGEGWEDYLSFGESEFRQAIQTAHDGVALDPQNDIREALDVIWASDAHDRLVMVYGDDSGGSGTEIWWAESPDGDPTSFGSEERIIDESDKAEDPNWLYDRPSRTLFLYHEDNPGHGEVAVRPANSRDGKTYGAKTVIGGPQWDIGIPFASPQAWRYNGQYFVGGEEHASTKADGRDLIIAKGPDPTTFHNGKIVTTTDDYPFIEDHINLQATYIDKTDTLHGYTNVDDGTQFDSYYLKATGFNAGWPTSFSIPNEAAGYNIGCILSMFNRVVVYGFDPDVPTQIVYWELNGTRDERSLADSGEQVSWTFYEPAMTPNSTVEWRVAVEDDGGDVERSETRSFEIDSGDNHPVAGFGDAALGDITIGD